SAADRVGEPRAVRTLHLGVEHHKFRHLIRMPLQHRLAQRLDALLARLDHEQLLALVLDAVVPAVDRPHLGDDVHARREALFDERLRQRAGVERGADRRQDDAGLHGWAAWAIRSAACRATSCAALRYW